MCAYNRKSDVVSAADKKHIQTNNAMGNEVEA
jgi:hypothetical protein